MILSLTAEGSMVVNDWMNEKKTRGCLFTTEVLDTKPTAASGQRAVLICTLAWFLMLVDKLIRLSGGQLALLPFAVSSIQASSLYRG